MSQNSNTKSLSLLIGVLTLIIFVKFGWLLVSVNYLPESGVSIESGRIKSTLHYRYRFASNTALPKMPTSKRPLKRVSSIQDMQLVGIYSSSNSCIVTVIKKAKSYILSNGDEINGFVLTGAAAKEAYFEKNHKIYTLKLFEEKKKPDTGSAISAEEGKKHQKNSDNIISSQDGITIVPKSMIKAYMSDINKAMRDIGLKQIKRENQMMGYKVRFIRKGSPFAELGLERGDVIKAINGEDIVDLNGPMNLLKTADSLEGLTITVIRKNEEKELEYEVQ